MKKIIFALITTTLIMIGCKDNSKNEENTVSEPEITMDEDQEKEWEELFNGSDLYGWKAFNSDSISNQWKAEAGAIAFSPAEGDRQGTENLITENEYESFELSLEWKISEGGNSGIMWGVQEGEDFNEPYLTGPEIQVLDNKAHPDAENGPIRQAGALYDMVPPSEDVTKPAGEWNTTVIRINHEDNKGSVEMNGTLVTEFPLHGEEWDEIVKNSKFKDWEDFGKSQKGHIALQDHGNEVWYRNIKIKELD